jgi:TatD DNase family protein
VNWIDTHAHLDDRAFDPDRAAVLTRCAEIGLGLITVGTSLSSSHAAVGLARRTRSVWATVGVHPHEARTLDPHTLDQLGVLAQDDHVVAIGEIGLDYYRDLSPRPQQRSAFRAQLELAGKMGLPVCLHNRDATEDLLAILREVIPCPRGVVHSFLGDARRADSFLERGLFLGLGGPITFPKNQRLREAAGTIPLDRILLETDCPYLTPVPHRGHRNEPAYVTYAAEEIARIKQISVETVAEQTTRNAEMLFNLR